MTVRHWLVMGSALAVMTMAGCRRASKDTSPVLATVGTVKITQKSLENEIRAMLSDEAQVKELLSDARKADRETLLEQVVQVKSMVQMGKQLNLDNDPKVKAMTERALASVYMQALVDRRVAKQEPTEVQLKALYDEAAQQGKSNGGKATDFPPFEKIRPQVVNVWKQRQLQDAQKAVLKEMEQKIKVVKPTK